MTVASDLLSALEAARELNQRLDDALARAERAEASAARAEEALRALIEKYDHAADDCGGECVPDRNHVVADLRAALSGGAEGTAE